MASLGTGIGAALTPQIFEFVKSVGVPAAIALLIIIQLGPKIDHGVAVADHVEALLTTIAARGCGPALPS